MKQKLRLFILLVAASLLLNSTTCALPQNTQPQNSRTITKDEFDVIEGRFHDGLGTYAEIRLANELIRQGSISQMFFAEAHSRRKMQEAIAALPETHQQRQGFAREIANIEQGARQGATKLLALVSGRTLQLVRHTPKDFAHARTGDVVLDFADGSFLPVSVKTDKTHRIAVAEGQTPDISTKWAQRYFRVTQAELAEMIHQLGFASTDELKSHYLNVARLVAQIIISKLALADCQPTDFSHARTRNIAAVKYLLRQLLHYKHGNDLSRVIIFDRLTGEVKWESLLEGVNIEALTPEQISFTPARPRGGNPISSTFGIRVDGRTVVTFQIKHRRGRARDTTSRYEFGDITTRLEIR